MPRPRFDKLPPERREAFLEAAAKEFAAHGYDGASLNRILEAAGVSKGVAYYYFNDKADLFLTTVERYSQELARPDELNPADLETLTADTFWPWVAALYRRPIRRVIDRPWAFGVVKAAGKLPPEVAASGSLAERTGQLMGFLGTLLARGQQVGAIRPDLPHDLLVSLFLAIDDAGDRWLLRHWHELSAEEIEQALDRVVDLLRRAVAPEALAVGAVDPSTTAGGTVTGGTATRTAPQPVPATSGNRA